MVSARPGAPPLRPATRQTLMRRAGVGGAMRLGVKVHWRDVERMAALAGRHGATVLEYQMLPGDLEANRELAEEALRPYRGRFELRVHQPEGYLHEGRMRFLDPSAYDPEERARSAAFLGECARHAMELGAKALLVHPGGVWRGAEPGGNPLLLRDALQDVPRHVRILLENMPAHYEMRSFPGEPTAATPATFRLPQGLAQVDDLVDGYVLDVSHAYLAAAAGTLEVPRLFVRELGARIRHVHASGSRGGLGPQGEGTPFDDSDYGAEFLRELLSGLPDDVVVVPEIMDGHQEDGRRFDEALAFLRTL